MICIVCKEEKPGSEEHIFPESLGGVLTVDRLCSDCNSRLGRLADVHLTNNALMELARFHFQISGKSGVVPNPLEKNVLEADENQHVLYEFGEDGRPEKLYMKPKKHVREDSRGELITFSRDASERHLLIQDVKKFLNRNSQTIPDEVISSRIREEEIKAPRLKTGGQIFMPGVYLAMTKIAFELAFHEFRDEFLLSRNGSHLSSLIYQLINLPKDEFKNWCRTGNYKIRGQVDIRADFHLTEECPPCMALFLSIGHEIHLYLNILDMIEGIFFIAAKDEVATWDREFAIENQTHVKKIIRYSAQDIPDSCVGKAIRYLKTVYN